MDTDQSNSTEEVVNDSAPISVGRPTSPVSFEGGSFNYGVNSSTVKLSRKNGPRNTVRVYDVNNGQYTNARRVKEQLFAPKNPAQTLSVGDATLGSFTLYEGKPTVYWQPSTDDPDGAWWLRVAPTIQDNGGQVKGEFNVSLQNLKDSRVGINANYKLYARVFDCPYDLGDTITSTTAGDYGSVELDAVAEANRKGININLGVMARGPTLTSQSNGLLGIYIGGYEVRPEVTATCGIGLGASAGAGIDFSRGRAHLSVGAFWGPGCQVSFNGDWVPKDMSNHIMCLPMRTVATRAINTIDEQLANPNLSQWKRMELEQLRDEQAVIAYQYGAPAADLEPRAITNGPGDGPQPPPPPGGAAPAPDQPNHPFRFNMLPDGWQPGEGNDGNNRWLLATLDEQGVFDAYLPEFLNPQQPRVFELPGYLRGDLYNPQFALENGVRQFTAADNLPAHLDQSALIKPYEGGNAPSIVPTITEINGKPAVGGVYTDEKSGVSFGVAANTDGDIQLSGGKKWTTSNGVNLGIGFSYTFDKKVSDDHQKTANELVAAEKQVFEAQYQGVCDDFTQHVIEGDLDAAAADIEKGKGLNGPRILGAGMSYSNGFDSVTVNFSVSFEIQEQLLSDLQNEPQDPAFHYSRVTDPSAKNSNDYATQVKYGYSLSIVKPIIDNIDVLVKKGYLPQATQQFMLLNPEGDPGLNFALQTQHAMLFAQPLMHLYSAVCPQLLPDDWLVLKKSGRVLSNGAQIFAPTLPALLYQRAMLSSEVFWTHAADGFINPFNSSWALAGMVALQLTTLGLSELPDDWSLCKNNLLPVSYYGLQGLNGGNAIYQLAVNGLDIAYMPSYVGTLAAIGFNIACWVKDYCNEGDLSTDPLTYQRRTTANVGIYGSSSVALALWAGFTLTSLPLAALAAAACIATHRCETPVKHGAMQALAAALQNIDIQRKKSNAGKIVANMTAIKTTLKENFSGLDYDKSHSSVVNAARACYAGYELTKEHEEANKLFEQVFLTPFSGLLAIESNPGDLQPEDLSMQLQSLSSALKKYVDEKVILACRRLLDAEQYQAVFDKLKQELRCKKIIALTHHSLDGKNGRCLGDHKLPALLAVELILSRLWAFATSHAAIADFESEYKLLATALHKEARENNAWYEKHWSSILSELKKIVTAFISNTLVFSSQMDDPEQRKEGLTKLMVHYSFVGSWYEVMEDRQLLNLAGQLYHLGDQANSQKAATRIRRWETLIRDQKQAIEAGHREACEPVENEQNAWFTRQLKGIYASLKYLGHDGRVKMLLKLDPPKELLVSFCDELLDQKAYKNLLNFIELLEEKNMSFEGVSIYRLRATHYQSKAFEPLVFLNDLFSHQPAENSTDDFKLIFWKSLLTIVTEFISISPYAPKNLSWLRSLLILHGLVTVCTDKLGELTVLDKQSRGDFQKASDMAIKFIEQYRGFSFSSVKKQAHDLFSETTGAQKAEELEALLRPIMLTFLGSDGNEHVYMPVDVPRDGDCAFHCLGISRKNGVGALKKAVGEDGWVANVYNIIVDDLSFKDKKTYSKEAEDKKNNLEHINKYLDGLAQPGVWLSHNQTSVSVFDALAYAQKKNLHIYEVSEKGKLILANNTEYHQPDFEDCHVLYSEGHYLRLKLFSAKVEELHDREQINLARNPNAHFAPPQAGPADEGLRQRKVATAKVAA